MALSEERLLDIEKFVKNNGDQLQRVQTELSKKCDNEKLDRRVQTVRKDVAGIVRTMSQCVQSLRHDITEGLKGKVNNDMLQGTADHIRQDLLSSLCSKLESEEIRSQFLHFRDEIFEVVGTKVDMNEVSSWMQEKLGPEDLRSKVLELRQEICAQKLDSEAIGKQLLDLKQEFLGLLEKKVDLQELGSFVTEQMDSQNLQSHFFDLKTELQKVASRTTEKVDSEDLQSQLSELKQEIQALLEKKADLQEVKSSFAEKLDSEEMRLQLLDLRQEILALLDKKVDLQDFGQGIQECKQTQLEAAEKHIQGANSQEIQQLRDAMRQEIQAAVAQKADVELVHHVQKMQHELSEMIKADTERLDLSVSSVSASLEDGMRRTREDCMFMLKNDMEQVDDNVSHVSAYLEKGLRKTREDFMQQLKDAGQKLRQELLQKVHQKGSIVQSDKEQQSHRQKLTHEPDQHAPVELSDRVDCMSSELQALGEQLAHQVDMCKAACREDVAQQLHQLNADERKDLQQEIDLHVGERLSTLQEELALVQDTLSKGATEVENEIDCKQQNEDVKCLAMSRKDIEEVIDSQVGGRLSTLQQELTYLQSALSATPTRAEDVTDSKQHAEETQRHASGRQDIEEAIDSRVGDTLSALQQEFACMQITLSEKIAQVEDEICCKQQAQERKSLAVSHKDIEKVIDSRVGETLSALQQELTCVQNTLSKTVTQVVDATASKHQAEDTHRCANGRQDILELIDSRTGEKLSALQQEFACLQTTLAEKLARVEEDTRCKQQAEDLKLLTTSLRAEIAQVQARTMLSVQAMLDTKVIDTVRSECEQHFSVLRLQLGRDRDDNHDQIADVQIVQRVDSIQLELHQLADNMTTLFASPDGIDFKGAIKKECFEEVDRIKQGIHRDLHLELTAIRNLVLKAGANVSKSTLSVRTSAEKNAHACQQDFMEALAECDSTSFPIKSDATSLANPPTSQSRLESGIPGSSDDNCTMDAILNPMVDEQVCTSNQAGEDLFDEMDRRMRAVTSQLVKLAKTKVDTQHMDSRLNMMRSEVSAEVQRRVLAVKGELSAKVDEVRNMMDSPEKKLQSSSEAEEIDCDEEAGRTQAVKGLLVRLRSRRSG